MIFNETNIPNAINIPFNWVADYKDGTHFSEYNFNNNSPNSFYDINQQNVARFGLIGQGMKFYFNTASGTFYLNGRRVNIIYEYDGKQIGLTSNENEKDLITYKQAYTEYNNKSGSQKSDIESISFGYKTTIKEKDIEIFFQPVVKLPFNQSAYMELKLTSNQDLNGELVFISRNKEVDRFKAPLHKGLSGNINWTIK